MNAWTLAFSDAAMEEKYATHTFANSAAVFVDLCALAMAANFLMFVWYLVANESGAVGGAAIVFISCGFGMVITRAVARMQDQKRARVYFGRLNVLSMLVTMSASLAYKNYYHLSEKVALSPVHILVFVLIFMFPIYFRITAVHVEHRIAAELVYSVTLALHPATSQVGQPTEFLLQFTALLLGEAMGHYVEWQVRLGHLRQNYPPKQYEPHSRRCEARSTSRRIRDLTSPSSTRSMGRTR